jgi:hypothetical protein
MAVMSPFMLVLPVFLALVVLVYSALQKAAAEAAQPTGTARTTAFLGLTAALAAVMQSAGMFIPVVGPALAMLSSLPVALGTLVAPLGAPWMVVAAAAVLAVLRVTDAAVFLLTMGPVGLTAAWALDPARPAWQRVLLPSGVLVCGMLLLTFVIGFPTFAGIVQTWGVAGATLIFAVFGLLYGAAWVRAVRRFARILSIKRKGTAA